jgi:hypothetical protein
MTGLMVHTKGSGRVTMEQAFAIPVPEKTKTYQPVPNEDLWNMLKNTAESKGLELGVPEMGITVGGQRLFGTVPIMNQDHLNNEVRLMMGFRNSYNKSLSVGVCFGSEVFVCDNMCFTGYASDGEDAVGQVHKRHSMDVWDGLQVRLNESMSQFEVFKSYQENAFNRMKEIALTDAEANHHIIQSVRAGAITANNCMKVADEWMFQGRGPQSEEEETSGRWHKEFAGRNVWSLYNCFTEIHKAFQEKNPFEANIRSIKMNNYVHQQFITN